MTIRRGGGPRDERGAEAGQQPPRDGTSARRPHVAPRRPGRAGTVTAYDMARQRQGTGLGSHLRVGIFLAVSAMVVLLLLGTVLRPLTREVIVGLADANPRALTLPFVADLVREDLGDALTAPASDDPSEAEFTVAAGESASGIAGRLVDDGLLRDERAFLLIAMERDLAGSLEAGTFLLRRNLTPEQLVGRLLEARDPSLTIQLRTGLRLEQMTAYLQARPAEIATLQLEAADFLDLVRDPPPALLADYPWLDLPDGATLEGYLAAGAYRILPDATAEELVRKMLDRFSEQLGPERLAAAREDGRTLHDVVTLASLVERETPVDAERPLVAGVYQNRVSREMLLNADPTVIWGVDLLALEALGLARWPEYSFWNVPKDPLAAIEFPAAIAGYQTYKVPGMIPGPICTPTVTSIEAAIAPATAKRYLYFVAIPGGEGTHDFSRTYEEHLAKLREYGYIR